MVDVMILAQHDSCIGGPDESDELFLLVDRLLREELQHSDLDTATRQRLLAAPVRSATIEIVVRTLRRLYARPPGRASD